MYEIVEQIDPLKVSQLEDYEINALKIFSDYHRHHYKECQIPENIYAICFYAMRKCGVIPNHFSDMQLHITQFNAQLPLIDSLRKSNGSSFGC